MNNKIIDVFNKFISELKCLSSYSPETIKSIKSSFDLFIKIVPTADIDNLSKEIILRFFQELQTRERIVGRSKIIKKGIKSTTILTYMNRLGMFFKWLIKNNYIKDNPLDKIEKPSIDNESEQKFLYKKDIDKILLAIEYKIKWSNNFIKKRNKAILLISLYSGLRRSELLGLEILNVNLDRNIMFISSNISKSSRSREIPINSDLKIVLEDYIQEMKNKGVVGKNLFCNIRGNKLTVSGFRHIMDVIVKSSGVNFHIHQFRHSFAMNMIANNVEYAKVGQLMGHKDIRSTLHYLKNIPVSSMKKDVENVSFNNLI